LCYSGAYLGTIVGIPVSSTLCAISFLGGWPAVFYVFGTLGILWFLFWIPFVQNDPATDPTISIYEREYIETSMASAEDEAPKKAIPWLKILTNLPFWALLINHTCNNWAFYTLLTWMPAYILHILHFDISSSGFISVLPYIGFTVAWIGGGQIADYMIAHWWSTTTVRKIFQTVGFAFGGVFLVVTGHLTSVVPAVASLTAAMTFMGLVGSGFANNHLDIGAEYSGVLMGITNTAATIPGIVSPVLTGWILGDTPHLQNWQNVFYISGGVFAFGIIVWLAFASGKRQF
jgi:MFS family permease